MIQVQTSDWKNFSLRSVFTAADHGWVYVELVRLRAYVRNPMANEGDVVWVLKVDSTDSGGGVNAAARVMAALVAHVTGCTEAEVVREDALDIAQLRRQLGQTGVLEFSRDRPTYVHYSAEEWLEGVTE